MRRTALVLQLCRGGKSRLGYERKLPFEQRESLRLLFAGQTRESPLEVRTANPWRDLKSASESSGNSARGDWRSGPLDPNATPHAIRWSPYRERESLLRGYDLAATKTED